MRIAFQFRNTNVTIDLAPAVVLSFMAMTVFSVPIA